MSVYYIGTPGKPPRLLQRTGDIPATLLRQGEVIVKGELGDWIISPGGSGLLPNDPPLEVIKNIHEARVDTQAEAARSAFMPFVGQGLTYLRKVSEAAAYTQDSSNPVPLLSAEASALGISLAQLVSDVLAASQAYAEEEVRIEVIRRRAKTEIAAATNKAEVELASEVVW